MTESVPSDAPTWPMRYRFRLRWLLLVMLMFSLMFVWLARESHRAKRQTRFINDLAQIEVRVRRSEPTGLALVARKVLGERDEWLSQRLDQGWLSRPSELVTWTATDEQIPKLVALVEQLDSVRELHHSVRELHLEQSPVTEQGIAALENELPGVAVLTRADLITRGAGRPREQFATAAVQLLAVAAAWAFCITIVLVWPFIRWRRSRRFLARRGPPHARNPLRAGAD